MFSAVFVLRYLHLLASLGLGRLVDEGLVDVGDDSSSGDGGLDEGVELLVSADGELGGRGGGGRTNSRR